MLHLVHSSRARTRYIPSMAMTITAITPSCHRHRWAIVHNGSILMSDEIKDQPTAFCYLCLREPGEAE